MRKRSHETGLARPGLFGQYFSFHPTLNTGPRIRIPPPPQEQCRAKTFTKLTTYSGSAFIPFKTHLLMVAGNLVEILRKLETFSFIGSEFYNQGVRPGQDILLETFYRLSVTERNNSNTGQKYNHLPTWILTTMMTSEY